MVSAPRSGPESLKPHTRAERESVAQALIPLWRRKFGEGLLAVAATGSLARGDDRAYSDLELVVFVESMPAADEDPYLQRIVDGMLVEAEYLTGDAYVARYATLPADWFLAGPAPLLPLHNPAFVQRVARRVDDIRYPREQFLAKAARRFVEVQEASGKVLSAVEAGAVLRCGDARAGDAVVPEPAAVHHLCPLAEGRAMPNQPARLDEMLDAAVSGGYHDLPHLRALILDVVDGLEQQFRAEDVAFVDAELDPNLPNRRIG
jgi:predicted nucleotidyltransferase